MEKAVEVEPNSTRTRLSLGFFHWATGDLVAAEQTFMEAIATNPKDELANRLVATFYADIGRAGQAEPYLKTLAATGNPASIVRLADFYLSLDRNAEATALLTPLAKDPASAALADLRLAGIAFDAKDKVKGHALVDSVLEREPRNVRALVLKAQWLHLDGKSREALDRAQAAVKANPNGAVLRTLAAEGLGADVVSIGEYLRARAAGVPADRIVFSGVGKTAAEMREAAQ